MTTFKVSFVQNINELKCNFEKTLYSSFINFDGLFLLDIREY